MNRVIALFLILHLLSCANDKEEGAVVSDQTIVSLAKNVSSFTYYKNNTDTLPSDPSSDHGAFVRIRFNPKAVAAMNDSVSNLSLSNFPDESMIVKEMFNNGTMTGYVVMYKMASGSDANHGWLWGEYLADNTPFYSVSKKGDRCFGCHLQPSNSDLVRTFSLH